MVIYHAFVFQNDEWIHWGSCVDPLILEIDARIEAVEIEIIVW